MTIAHVWARFVMCSSTLIVCTSLITAASLFGILDSIYFAIRSCVPHVCRAVLICWWPCFVRCIVNARGLRSNAEPLRLCRICSCLYHMMQSRVYIHTTLSLCFYLLRPSTMPLKPRVYSSLSERLTIYNQQSVDLQKNRHG